MQWCKRIYLQQTRRTWKRLFKNPRTHKKSATARNGWKGILKLIILTRLKSRQKVHSQFFPFLLFCPWFMLRFEFFNSHSLGPLYAREKAEAEACWLNEIKKNLKSAGKFDKKGGEKVLRWSLKNQKLTATGFSKNKLCSKDKTCWVK